MVRKNNVPDAWDDDWEAQADKLEEEKEPEPPVPMTKAERLAKHAEANKKIWESASVPLVYYCIVAKLIPKSERLQKHSTTLKRATKCLSPRASSLQSKS